MKTRRTGAAVLVFLLCLAFACTAFAAKSVKAPTLRFQGITKRGIESGHSKDIGVNASDPGFLTLWLTDAEDETIVYRHYYDGIEIHSGVNYFSINAFDDNGYALAEGKYRLHATMVNQYDVETKNEASAKLNILAAEDLPVPTSQIAQQAAAQQAYTAPTDPSGQSYAYPSDQSYTYPSAQQGAYTAPQSAPAADSLLNYSTSANFTVGQEGYQIGDGKNVMVLTFAIHGWEDNWARDGAELVTLADRTKAYLEANYALVENGNWTVYILRCLNPDGLYLGTTCNGQGRCTTTYYNAHGSLISGSGVGIDMNRCFPYNYKTRTDARNYNGTAPLQAKEARALASFMQKAKGSGKNICIDTHGWYSQIITSSGKGTIYKALLKQFPDNTYASLSGGSGYFSSWCAYELGYDSCLLELPSSVTSHARFESIDCTGRFTRAIEDLLQNYQNRGATREAFIPPQEELDGN